MQNLSQVPIFSDVADWFAYPALNASQQTSISITNAGGTNKGYITLQPQHYFAHCAWAAVTNYDNAGGLFSTADSGPIMSLPAYPNCFTVEIQRGSSNNYSNLALTQAELCSAGILSGKQNPIPVIYGGAVTLSFNFTDLTGLFLEDEADAAIPLSLQLWMIGYSIPEENWERFQMYFPGLQKAYK